MTEQASPRRTSSSEFRAGSAPKEPIGFVALHVVAFDQARRIFKCWISDCVANRTERQEIGLAFLECLVPRPQRPGDPKELVGRTVFLLKQR